MYIRIYICMDIYVFFFYKADFSIASISDLLIINFNINLPTHLYKCVDAALWRAPCRLQLYKKYLVKWRRLLS